MSLLMGASRNTSGSDETDRESGIAFSRAHADDKRRFIRSEVCLPVRLIHGDGVPLAGSCVNLSRGGMFVQLVGSESTTVGPAPGESLRIWLALRDGESTDELFLTGEVRWAGSGPQRIGLGIQHSVLAASDTVRLADFLAAQQIANPQTSE